MAATEFQCMDIKLFITTYKYLCWFSFFTIVTGTSYALSLHTYPNFF